MTTIQTIEGDFTHTQDAHFGIVLSRFNSFIVERLLEGTLDTLKRHGVSSSNITVVRVPGAYELPIAARAMVQNPRYAAIIALGCVIRGATPHFDYVASETAKGLAQIGLQQDIPITFGVLTTDTIEQAIERAGTKAGNKGADAAMSALEMVSLLAKLRGTA